MQSRRKGLSIVEVLIVVAILALLAAILFPVFRSAKVESHKTAAVSAMKKFYSAYALYSSDYDVYEETPGMGGLSVSPLVQPLLTVPYGFKKELCFSAVVPQGSAQRNLSCYWSMYPPLLPDHPDYAPMMDVFRTDLAEKKGAFIIAADYSFDMFLYASDQTGEANRSPHKKLRLALQLSGSVRKEWKHLSMAPPTGGGNQDLRR